MEDVSFNSNAVFTSVENSVQKIAVPVSGLLARVHLNNRWKNKEIPSRVVLSQVYGLSESQDETLEDVCDNATKLDNLPSYSKQVLGNL
ncbi:MAG: hypothetical protein K6F05_00745 [Succinivibrio sp.]|nr:hypothetical protein [Succinivibrio sp.]